MLGDFGEVLLLDWGLALVQGAPTRATTPPGRHAAPAEESPNRPCRPTARGTPQPAPCSARRATWRPSRSTAAVDALDARTDVYALGVILYMSSSRSSPSTGRHGDGRIFASIGVDGASPAKTHPSGEVAPGARRRLREATARDRRNASRRPRSARAIERYLDGDRDAAGDVSSRPSTPPAPALMDSLPAKMASTRRRLARRRCANDAGAGALDRGTEATAVLAAALLDRDRDDARGGATDGQAYASYAAPQGPRGR